MFFIFILNHYSFISTRGHYSITYRIDRTIHVFYSYSKLFSHFFKVEAARLSHLCLLFVWFSWHLWWLTLLSWIGINSLRKAYPILKAGIHWDSVGLVGLKASYLMKVKKLEWISGHKVKTVCTDRSYTSKRRFKGVIVRFFFFFLVVKDETEQENQIKGGWNNKHIDLEACNTNTIKHTCYNEAGLVSVCNLKLGEGEVGR